MSGLAVRVSGQASKRGLIPRLPPADRLLADATAHLTTHHADTIRWLRPTDPAEGRPARLAASFHPAAATVELTIDDEGRVSAHAPTSPVGPGYHTFVSRLLERLGAELEIAWAPEGATPGEPGDPGDAFPLATRAAAERAHLAWLRPVLLRALEARRGGATGLHLGTPPGVRFATDGAALLTRLGPRDDAWLERAVSDPRTAVEAWPWFSDAVDARHLLNRALCLMWTDVRWRVPIDDGERAVIDEVLGLLRHGYPLEPGLQWPWREWAELLDLRNIEDPTVRRTIERALPTADGMRIGYRREPVTIVHGGWALTVPGSFSERRSQEEWVGGEAGREVTIAGVETGTGSGPMRPETFLGQVAGHLGSEALEHREGPILGRARLATDASSGIEVGTVEGYAAVTGRGAAIRVVFSEPSDWQWALDLWKGLRPA